jgi:hypothetical protein
MPGDRQLAKLRNLGLGLLHVVLSEIELAGRAGGAYRGRRLLLAHRDQADCRGVTSGEPGSRDDPSALRNRGPRVENCGAVNILGSEGLIYTAAARAGFAALVPTRGHEEYRWLSTSPSC